MNNGWRRVWWRVAAAAIFATAFGVNWFAGLLLDLVTWLMKLAQSARRRADGE